MTMNKKIAFLAGACLLAGSLVADAAGLYTNGVPPAGGTQYPTTIPLTGVETIPADTNLTGGLNPASEAITVTQLNGASLSAYGSGGSGRNGLIGGDFGINQWQRGTTASANIASTLTYYADGWWNLGGASSSINVTKETGATDITNTYAASARFQRTSANTDVVKICTGQVLPSAQSTRYQGKTVEFSSHLLAGANFSAASSQVTMTIGYGTGSDQSAATFAGGTWTGQVNASQLTTIGTTWGRFNVVASIPVTATQIGVEICYVPVGTAGTNDWFEFTGAQLDENAAAVANNGSGTVSGNMASFERRPITVEQDMEDFYYQQVNETNGGYFAPGQVTATNVEKYILPLTQMRATPTCTFTAGGFDANIAGTNAAVGTLTQVTGSTSSSLTIGDTKTATAGGTAFLNGTNTTGAIKCTAEL